MQLSLRVLPALVTLSRANINTGVHGEKVYMSCAHKEHAWVVLAAGNRQPLPTGRQTVGATHVANQEPVDAALPLPHPPPAYSPFAQNVSETVSAPVSEACQAWAQQCQGVKAQGG